MLSNEKLKKNTSSSHESGLFSSLSQVTNQTLAFSFIIQQDISVRNLQPAIVKVYDYYETGEPEMVMDPCGFVLLTVPQYVDQAGPKSQTSIFSVPNADISGIWHHTHC